MSSSEAVITPAMVSSIVSPITLAAKTKIAADGLQNGFPFMRLPPELRHMIYELIFVCPANIGSEGNLTRSFWRHVKTWRNLSFARSCREIWSECGHLFLSRNRFEFYCIRSFLEFLEAIGNKGRQLLTKVRYFYSKGRPFIVLRYLRSLSNIRELEVYARICKPKCSGSWWLFPIIDMKNVLKEISYTCCWSECTIAYWSTRHHSWLNSKYQFVKYGPIIGVGKAAALLDDAPMDKCEEVKRSLAREFKRVRGEALGIIVR